MQLSWKMIRLDSHRRRLDPQPPHKAPCLVDCEFGNYWEVGCISTNFGNSHVFWWIGARVTYSYCACIRTCILDQTESSKPGCTWGAIFEEHLTWGKPQHHIGENCDSEKEKRISKMMKIICPPPMLPQRHWDLFQNNRVLRIWKYCYHYS